MAGQRIVRALRKWKFMRALTSKFLSKTTAMAARRLSERRRSLVGAAVQLDRFQEIMKRLDRLEAAERRSEGSEGQEDEYSEGRGMNSDGAALERVLSDAHGMVLASIMGEEGEGLPLACASEDHARIAAAVQGLKGAEESLAHSSVSETELLPRDCEVMSASPTVFAASSAASKSEDALEVAKAEARRCQTEVRQIEGRIAELKDNQQQKPLELWQPPPPQDLQPNVRPVLRQNDAVATLKSSSNQKTPQHGQEPEELRQSLERAVPWAQSDDPDDPDVLEGASLSLGIDIVLV